MKKMIIAGAAMASFCAVADPADPQITSIDVTQNTMTRRVKVEYTLDEPAIVTMDVLTNGVSIGGENIQYVSGECNKLVQPTGAGESRKIFWQPDKSWPDHKFTEPVVSVKVTAWATNAPPDYMVVDLADVPDVVRYYPAAGFLPGGITENQEYRTSKIVMRRILAKDVTFTMGSGPLEPGRNADREKTHSYKLGRNYYIGVFEVTQGQWSKVTTTIPAKSFTKAGEREGRPVSGVCFNILRRSDVTGNGGTVSGGNYPDAPYGGSFLGLLRDKTHIDFDLPCEGEWEYACRAGTGDEQWNNGQAYALYGSNNIMDDGLPGRYRHNGGNYDDSQNRDATFYATTSVADGGTDIVGRHAPNGWGLYDMHGNVWEFCVDVWENDNSGRHEGVNAVASGSTTANTAYPYRGGAWTRPAVGCRTALRSNDNGNTVRDTLGFRLVCTAGLE